MRTPDLSKALESFSSILAEKQSVSEKERGVIEKLNRAITNMGYRIVPIKGGKRKGRPLGSRNKPKQSMPSINMDGTNKRHPGRPKLKNVA